MGNDFDDVFIDFVRLESLNLLVFSRETFLFLTLVCQVLLFLCDLRMLRCVVRVASSASRVRVCT